MKVRKTEKELDGYRNQDLKGMDLTWEEVQQLPVNREEWHQSVAQCVFVFDTE